MREKFYHNLQGALGLEKEPNDTLQCIEVLVGAVTTDDSDKDSFLMCKLQVSDAIYTRNSRYLQCTTTQHCICQDFVSGTPSLVV